MRWRNLRASWRDTLLLLRKFRFALLLFGLITLSAGVMSASTLAAAAIGADVTRPLTIEGGAFSLGRVFIQEHSRLCHKSIADIEKMYDLSVILFKRDTFFRHSPAGDNHLRTEGSSSYIRQPRTHWLASS